MNLKKSLSVFAVAGLVTASVVSFSSAHDPYAELPLPYGDLLSRTESSLVGSDAAAALQGSGAMDYAVTSDDGTNTQAVTEPGNAQAILEGDSD